MASRISWIVTSALLPLIAFGQQNPPPEVDQALRARVTQFMQYHVEGNFRKAYDMVAEDTKDEYFNMDKVHLQGFKIGDVKFTDNFTKASVTATMSKTINIVGQEFPISTPSTTTWKIENGKWVWYDEAKPAWTNPVGLASAPAAAAAPTANANADAALPKEFDDKTLASAARSILQQVSVDKKEITLAVDKTSEEKVIFHNGMPGSVQLELSAPEIPGFTVTLGQRIVRAGADVPVVFHYQPVGGDKGTTGDGLSVQLTVQPLDQTFVIRVNFAASGPVK
jgi:hypothetical protein